MNDTTAAIPPRPMMISILGRTKFALRKWSAAILRRTRGGRCAPVAMAALFLR